MAIITRNDGTVIDAATVDVDFVAGIEVIQVTSGVITINVRADGIVTSMIADGQITLAKLAGNSVDSSKIVDGSIVDADVNAAAAIAFSKLSGVAAAIHSHVPTVTERTANSSTATGTRTITVSCLGSEIALGGGCNDTVTNANIWENLPVGNGWGCTSTSASSHFITAHVMCLSTPIS